MAKKTQRIIKETTGLDTSKGWLSGLCSALFGVNSRREAMDRTLYADNKKGKKRNAK